MKCNLIYDCFLFFNEFELLEIRLNLLFDIIDKFVLVEANKTFSNKEKPFYFYENIKNYKTFLKKIIHIKINEYPITKDAWEMEKFQRNQISQGLLQCDNNDIILISDLDEIPNPDMILKYNKYGSGICKLKQVHFDYYLNYQRIGPTKYWYSGKIARYKDIIDYTPQQIRSTKDIRIIKNAGWHFSFLGGIDNIIYKIQSFSHQEWNNEKYLNEKIKQKIFLGKDLFDRPDRRLIPIKISLKNHPAYIVNNIDKYTNLIYSPINYYIVIKNRLYCFPFYLKSKITQFLKILLPKNIVILIKNRKIIMRNKKYNIN